MAIDGGLLAILLTGSSGLRLSPCSEKNLTSAGTATPITLRLWLHFMGAHAASVKNQVNMGRIRKFFYDAARLKPYYRVCSNVATGLGIAIGSGLWYFTLVPLLAASLGIDVAGFAQTGDPTALFAIAMVLLLVVSMITCVQGVFFALVLLGRLRLADVKSVVWRLRYPRSWINF